MRKRLVDEVVLFEPVDRIGMPPPPQGFAIPGWQRDAPDLHSWSLTTRLDLSGSTRGCARRVVKMRRASRHVRCSGRAAAHFSSSECRGYGGEQAPRDVKPQRLPWAETTNRQLYYQRCVDLSEELAK
jgi:hypothetical protein